MVSLGGDAHYRDPLGGLRLSTAGYLEVARMLREVSGRVAFMLEGGYDLEALADVIAAITGLMAGKDVEMHYPESPEDPDTGRKVVEEVREVMSEYWEL